MSALWMLYFTIQLVCICDLRLLPTNGETADAKRPWEGTGGPIQLKNGVISQFPHFRVSTMWAEIYRSQGSWWKMTGSVIDFTPFSRRVKSNDPSVQGRRFFFIYAFIMAWSKWFHSLHDKISLGSSQRLWSGWCPVSAYIHRWLRAGTAVTATKMGVVCVLTDEKMKCRLTDRCDDSAHFEEEFLKSFGDNRCILLSCWWHTHAHTHFHAE